MHDEAVAQAGLRAPAPAAWRVSPLWRGAGVALALLLAAALLVRLALPAWWERLAALVALYVVTPVGKEALIPLAETSFGVPAPAAALLFLLVNAFFCLLALLVVPVERLGRVARAAERLRARVAESRLARRGLALGLGVALALPVHSGGAILGALAGRGMGLSRAVTFAVVVGATAARFAAVLLAWEGYLLAR